MIKPVLRYPGAKWRLAEWVINHFPAHVSYLEPYFGSGAVFFKKPPSKIETINDLSGDVCNLFRIIREHPEELCRLIEATPWARAEYELSYTRTGVALEDARRFLVRCWQAFGVKTLHKSGWARDIGTKSRGNRYVNIWADLPVRISAIAHRLKNAQIEMRPAVDVIKGFADPNVLIYADPPYIAETRTKMMYAHEMTNDDHVELLDALDAHPGFVILSGYSNSLYDERLSHWTTRRARSLAQCAKITTEVLWLNPLAAAAQKQVELTL